MFQSTRFKLTAWYLLITMLISLLFSIVIYTVINQEYSRIEITQKLRQEREQQRFWQQQGFQVYPTPIPMDHQIILEARERLLVILLLVNLCILSLAGMIGYFLAGRTLQPIKKAIDDQNRFITDASHELRTPITSLKTAIEVYLRSKKLVNLRGKNHDRESIKLLESNLEEVNNLRLLADSLIKLTKYQKGQDVNFEEIKLSVIINEALRRVSILAKQKNITITSKAKNVMIEGNESELIEVFVILLDNAIKYSNKDTRVIITSENINHFVIVSVSDQGIGIAKENLPFLFGRFYRVDKSRSKTNVFGYGLGLSIVKQIIDKHSGFVKIISEVNKGTTISLHIPIKNKS